MKISKVMLFSMLAVFVLTGPRAGAVKFAQERGGGHPLAFEFQRAFQRAFRLLKDQAPEMLTAEQWETLKAKARDANYVIANEDVLVEHDGIQLKVVAANDVKTQTLTIDGRDWSKIDNPEIAAATAFHEVASLAGLEESGRYHLSARYVELVDESSAKCEDRLLAAKVEVAVKPENVEYLIRYHEVLMRLEKLGVLTLAQAKAGTFEAVVESTLVKENYIYDWMIYERLTLPNGKQFLFYPREPKELSKGKNPASFQKYLPEKFPAPYPHKGGPIYI